MPAMIISGTPHQMIASRTPLRKSSCPSGIVMKPMIGAPPGSLAFAKDCTSSDPKK